VGSQLTLSLGGEALTPAIAAATPPAAAYGSARFQFQQAMTDGSPYSITSNGAPANQTCLVYAGQTGNTPIAAGALRAGCEWTYDLVSRSTDDLVTTGADYSKTPAVGGANVPIGSSPAYGEGRFVAFRSNMVGLAGNAMNFNQVFWRDRLTGATRLVSKGSDGKEGDGISEQPAISADGLTVAFRSSATNLVASDGNESADIFVWRIDLATGAETLVRASIGPAGEEANQASEMPSLSGDGKILAFTTNATNVAPAANDSTLNNKIVRRDLTSGTNTLVTLRKNGDPGTGRNPKISEDGNRIVYWSYSDVVGDLDTNLWDMFVYEHGTKQNWPVTLAQSGALKNQGNESVSGILVPTISGDGKWVTYGTTATNIAPGFDNKEFHVYVVEVDNCKATGCNVKPVDMTPAGTQADVGARSDHASISYDGRWVVFTSSAPNLGGMKGVTNVFLYDRESNKTERITEIESTYSAGAFVAISRSGAYIGFGCESVLDPRFPDTTGYGGLYALFTGHADAFGWPR
jgi:Tol biopolymer transport system component